MTTPTTLRGMPKQTPAESLLAMLADLKTMDVEELDHRDWHGLLRSFETLIKSLEPLSKKGPRVMEIRAALMLTAQRARKDRLPMPQLEDEESKGSAE